VEEAEKIEKETGDKALAWEDPDEHQFFVPKRARWSELQKIAHDLGDAINKANEALEEPNPQKQEGVLANINFNDKERLRDFLTVPESKKKQSKKEIVLSSVENEVYEFLRNIRNKEAEKKERPSFTIFLMIH